MKECIAIEKHDTCQRRAWSGDRSKKLCNYGGSFQSCFYKPDFIRFKDIEDGTIMFSGDIESTCEFKTKAEWIKGFGHDDFRAECDEAWYTAVVKTAGINLASLLKNTAESEEMYDDWYSDVLSVCEEDPIVEAGIKRLNEILAFYPSYTEDMKVVFD
jgi:hypothetical protein